MNVLLMVIVLGLFVIGGAALLKAHSEPDPDPDAERGKRKGITPIYKRSSAMDAGGSVGLFGWGGSSDGGPTGRRRMSGSGTAKRCRNSWKARRAV